MNEQNNTESSQEEVIAHHFMNALEHRITAITQNTHPADLSTPQGVVAYMSAAKSEVDWNARCDAVKAANGGYPSFWFFEIVMSGVASRTQNNWES